MTKRNAGKRLVRLDVDNHQFLDSLIEKNAITSFNDALTKIISYVKSKPDFSQEIKGL